MGNAILTTVSLPHAIAGPHTAFVGRLAAVSVVLRGPTVHPWRGAGPRRAAGPTSPVSTTSVSLRTARQTLSNSSAILSTFCRDDRGDIETVVDEGRVGFHGFSDDRGDIHQLLIDQPLVDTRPRDDRGNINELLIDQPLVEIPGMVRGGLHTEDGSRMVRFVQLEPKWLRMVVVMMIMMMMMMMMMMV